MEDFKDNFKEIEGLLETTVNPEPVTAPRRIKKFIKLVLPHVALVITVCVYASLGAWIFYTLESPNEDSLKEHGKHAIGQMRGSLIQLIKEGRGMKKNWKESVEKELYRFNDNIYKAYKEQYVRYPDVKVALRYDISDEKEDGDRTKRHRNSRTRERGEKLWTASSALFFAATTMATIGYGNIVPATSGGRIACVLFALIGAPLAIITIGDLGKFLSECTIWLYKQMKKAKEVIRRRWRRFRIGKGHLDDCEMQSVESQKPKLNWEDLDKSEVPVLMVFTILLMYIAFGGILFSFLEGWSYMDAFYYSFISLTTIGFGDIVPENHDYIILMLIYLGVGLAVTTMCIDLVGIQYIQKIHYFGRKFRGTDLLQLLKRKRMLERRLAMGQGEEILQFYMQEMQSQMPEPVMVEEPQWPPEPLKTPSPTEWLIDDSLMTSRHSYTYPLAEQVPSPNVLSIRSFRLPSIYSNSSASARSLMHLRLGARGGSWDESGPSLSEHCSLSTEPSVHIRQAYWDEFRSPDPSVTSFAFDFPLPSPDYSAIAREARSSRRLNSCPPDPPWPPSHSNSPVGLACMEDWDSYIRMLEEYEKPYERDESEDSTIDFPVQVNALPVRKPLLEIFFEEDEDATEEEVLLHYGHEDEPIPVFSVGELPLDGPSTLNNIIHCPVKYISKTPPSLVVDNYCFICDGDEVSEEDILKDQQWWKQTSCTTRFYSSENLTTFHQVTLLQCRGEMRGAYRTKERGGGLTKVSLSQVFRVSRFFSCWKTCHSFHRIVSVISPVTEQGEVNNNFKKRIFIQYFWRQERQQDRELVQREYLEQQMRMKVSPRHSLVPPSTSYRTRAQYPSSSSSMSSFDSTSPRHSTIKEESKWRILNRVYQTKKAFMSNRRALAPPRDNKQ